MPESIVVSPALRHLGIIVCREGDIVLDHVMSSVDQGIAKDFRSALRHLSLLRLELTRLVNSRIKAGESELLRYDLVMYSQFFQTKKNDTATKVADTVNDTYIKTSGDEQGVMSYGQVSDYLVSWYIQEVVAPTMVEEEQKFDPYDETQVDLSGLPYSPTEESVPEDTEAEEEE